MAIGTLFLKSKQDISIISAVINLIRRRALPIQMLFSYERSKFDKTVSVPTHSEFIIKK